MKLYEPCEITVIVFGDEDIVMASQQQPATTNDPFTDQNWYEGGNA